MAKRGRPTGWVMPDHVKAKISKSKTGQEHAQTTRDKISDSLLAYFEAERKPSKDLLNAYSDDPEACAWLENMAELIDCDDSFTTEKHLRNHHELLTPSIDAFGHKFTPEDIRIASETAFVRERGWEYRQMCRRYGKSKKNYLNKIQ